MWNALQVIFSHYQIYACLIASYLLGSIPTGYLIGKIFFRSDVRKSGSGNIGATNALRSFGIGSGAAVLAIDVLKGVLAILLASHNSMPAGSELGQQIFICLNGIAVVIGHDFSIFLNFRGGKGVATSTGVLFMLMPIPMILCVLFFIFVVFFTNYVSLASILTAFAVIIIELVSQIVMHFPDPPRLVMVIVIAGLLIWRHKDNLKRLRSGTENKFRFNKEK